MKTHLNLTIDENLVSKIKEYADLHNISVSAFVENYFREVVEMQAKTNNLIELIESLPKVDLGYPEDVDFKKQYYEERASKYGF